MMPKPRRAPASRRRSRPASTASRCSRNCSPNRFGMRFLRGGRFEIAFVKPVLFGDRLTAHIRVAGSASDETALEVWVTNGAGERVLGGTAAIAGSAR